MLVMMKSIAALNNVNFYKWKVFNHLDPSTQNKWNHSRTSNGWTRVGETKKDIGILNWFIFIHFELKPKINIELFIIYSDLDQP